MLIHPLIAALLPFFVPNPEYTPHDYSFDIISGQIVYRLYEITREVAPDKPTPIAHGMNIGFATFPRLLAIVVMVVSSVAVAVKLLLYRAPVQMQSNAAKKNTHRSTSITLLILAAVFFISYAPFCFVMLADVTGSLTSLGFPVIFYLTPSCYLIAYVSSAVNPMVYQLRGRSIFENKTNERKGTVYVNHVSRQETRMSVVDESRL